MIIGAICGALVVVLILCLLYTSASLSNLGFFTCYMVGLCMLVLGFIMLLWGYQIH